MERILGIMRWLRSFGFGNDPPVPPPPPRPIVNRPFHTYWPHPFPTYEQILTGAQRFDRIISDHEHEMYSFVGPWVCSTQGSEGQVYGLDVLLDKRLLDNGGSRLYQIVDAHHHYLALTPDKHLVVILEDTSDVGIAVKLWFTEGKEYPFKLIPPWNSRFRIDAIHGQSEPTYWERCARGAGMQSKPLPMLKWRHLLHQRLLHLHNNPSALEERERHIREMRVFLYFAKHHRDRPFSPEEVRDLQPKLNIWIQVATASGQDIREDLRSWLEMQ